MSAATHTIRLQRIEVTLNGSESDGFALQSRLSALCSDVLASALERALERYAPAEGHLFLERLEIDLGAVALDRLEQELPDALRSAVEKAFRDIPSARSASDSEPASGGQSASFRSDVQATWAAFLHFLETGRLPWAYRLLAGASLENAVARVLTDRPDARQFFGEKFWACMARETVRDRLLRQFSPAFLGELVEHAEVETAAAVRQVLAALRPHFSQEVSAFLERIVWKTALERLAGAGFSARPVGSNPAAGGVSAAALHILAESLAEAERQRPASTAALRAAAGQGAAEPWVAAALAATPDQSPRQFSPAFLGELAKHADQETAAAVRQVLAALRPHFSQEVSAFLERIVWKTALARLAAAGFSVRPVGSSPAAGGVSAAAMHILAESLAEAERQRPASTNALRTAAGQGTAEPWVADALAAGPDQSPRSGEARLPVEATPVDAALPKEGLILDHAGLVLLHPFLPQFFRALGVADDAVLTQPDRALHLLYFLSTGKTPAPEHELTFAKILCGIPLGQPVEGHIELTDNEVAEAINLLDTVIRYWDALRGTSPDGLREAFLRRPGKLTPSDDGGWVLYMEKQTLDILFQQLPWGIGMIQLPWMPALLRVEWAE